jgi:hypothetical protein
MRMKQWPSCSILTHSIAQVQVAGHRDTAGSPTTYVDEAGWLHKSLTHKARAAREIAFYTCAENARHQHLCDALSQHEAAGPLSPLHGGERSCRPSGHQPHFGGPEAQSGGCSTFQGVQSKPPLHASVRDAACKAMARDTDSNAQAVLAGEPALAAAGGSLASAVNGNNEYFLRGGASVQQACHGLAPLLPYLPRCCV